MWCPGAPSSLWVPTPCCIAGVVVLMLTASFGLGRLFVVSHRLATLKRCRLRRGHRWQLVSRRDEAILSGCPAAEVERRGIGRLELREILLEGLMDMGTCALHDRLKPAEPHPDQFPNTVCPSAPLSITVSHCASSGPSGRTIRPLGLI